METDNNSTLEVRPLVLQSVVEDGVATLTHVEATSLDLHVLNVNNYNHTLIADDVNANKIQVSISEQDAALLSIAMLNPSDVIVGNTAFQNLGMDFGSGLTKTYRKYLKVSKIDCVPYNSIYDVSGSDPLPETEDLFSSVTISMRNGYDADGYSQDLKLLLKTDLHPNLMFLGKVKTVITTPFVPYGEQEINGVSLFDGDVVLVANSQLLDPMYGFEYGIMIVGTGGWGYGSMLREGVTQPPVLVLSETGYSSGFWLSSDPMMTGAWSQLTEDVDFSIKTSHGFDIKIPFKSFEFGETEVNDARWVEFVSRNDGIIITPQVTGLTAPVDGGDAVNLDYLNQQVALQEQSDEDVLDYLDQKEQDLLPLIENQDSFFGTATSRWYGTRVVTVQDGYLAFPDVTKLSFKSSFLGVVKPNLDVDESAMTPEEIAASYRRRVFTDGVVKDAMFDVGTFDYNHTRTDLYLSADGNGQISDQPPTKGRIIKIGQRSGNDIIVAIEDRGFVTGTQVKRKFYDFGALTPSARPPEPPPPQSSAALLMHFQNLNNSGTASGTLELGGSAGLTTLDSKFGGYSFAPGNNANNYLRFDNQNGDITFGTGDFTIECWFKLLGYGSGVDGLGANSLLAFNPETSGDGQTFLLYVTGPSDAYPGKLRCIASDQFGTWGWALDMGENADVSLNEWHHAAVVRYGNEISVYLDGVRQDGPSHSNPVIVSPDTVIRTARYLTIGQYNGGLPHSFNGFIDEVRIIVGSAAYTGPFTPPSSPLE